MTMDEAVAHLQTTEEGRALLRETYIGCDVEECGARFLQSGEFRETLRIVGPLPPGCTVLDVGAGNGIASRAWAVSGAARVLALEPNPSSLLGQGALRRLCQGLPVEVLEGYAEAIPLPEGSVDLVYARQVLHHARDLRRAAREFFRVLRPGGLLLACREHVADDEAQLRAFLAAHPTHRLAGGEHAWPLGEYREAIAGAGFTLLQTLGPWDSLLNAHPAVDSREELEELPARVLSRRIGPAGRWLAALPPVSRLVWRRLKRPVPGRLYSFLARRP